MLIVRSNIKFIIKVMDSISWPLLIIYFFNRKEKNIFIIPVGIAEPDDTVS